MTDDAAAAERLGSMAEELARQGLQVESPSGSRPEPDEPDIGYIAVRDPATGRYAEVSLVRCSPDASDWFLQLSFWTLHTEDPDGLQMASGVVRLLSDSHVPQSATATRPARASDDGYGTDPLPMTSDRYAREGDPRGWVQVMNTMLERLVSGVLKPCGKVPVQRALARETGVSLNAVRGYVFPATITVPSGRPAIPRPRKTAVPGDLPGNPHPSEQEALHAMLTRIAAGQYTGRSRPGTSLPQASASASGRTLTRCSHPLPPEASSTLSVAAATTSPQMGVSARCAYWPSDARARTHGEHRTSTWMRAGSHDHQGCCLGLRRYAVTLALSQLAKCARAWKGVAVKLHGRRFSVLRGAAAAGAAAVLAVAGCGAARTLAPGPARMTVRPACARPAAPLGADQLRAAYQAPGRPAGAVTGAGTVIAVIVPSTAAPHVATDVAVYSRRFGLPAPQVQVLSYRHVPPPSDAGDAGWEREGTLDLEMAHVLAPQARLVYLAVPDSAAASGGRVMYDAALAWLVTRYRITVVTYSAGTPEAWAARGGYRFITASRAGLEAAARAGTTVVASAGDYGPAEPGLSGQLQRTVAWPASDPLATAVGGTRLTAVTTGGHTAYSSSVFAYADGVAGGAGLSAVFSRPPWQDGVAAVTGSRRGVADISMDASPCSAVTAFTSTSDLPGRHPGWISVSGTSIAAPLFAGAVADAAQAAGHSLGVLGPALYQMHGAADGITDITAGTDTFPGFPGYPSRPGYDLPTGIGTITSIPLFARTLARLARSRP